MAIEAAIMANETESELARKLAAATISNLEFEKTHGKAVNPNAPGLLNLPAIPLKKILSLVASPSFNKPPIFHQYMRARSAIDLETRGARQEAEYSVKNLMSLRRVCTVMEDFINNMSPNVDYEPIDIDVKLQGFADTREVTFYKYGGTGSQHSATRLARIRRFNEYKEHVEHFERIQKLYIVNIPLSEELFETLLTLDLKKLKKLSFEKIPDIKFNEDVNVRDYIQNFLNALDSSASVVFNSNEFDPNAELFPVENPDAEDIEMENELEDAAPVIVNGRHWWWMGRDPIHPHNHKHIRGLRRRAQDYNYHAKRSVKILSSVLGTEVAPSEAHMSKNEAHFHAMKQLKRAFEMKAITKSGPLRKSGRFHLRKVLALLEGRPIKSRKAVYFHLKMLKKISGKDPIVTDDEKILVEQLEDEKARSQFLQNFPFFDQLPRTRRNYIGEHTF